VAIGRLRAGEGDLYARNEAVELMGKTLGVVGYGRIARRVAAAGLGLGMSVSVYDPFVPHVDAGIGRSGSLVELLRGADAISVHVPLTPDTRHMFDAQTFAAMRPGAIFVNTARGGLVDQDALLAAVDSGHLFAAGLDVTDPEPLPVGHPLLDHPHVIVTPHVASGTGQGKRNNFTMALDQLVQIARGRRPPHLVNPEVWPQVVRRRRDLWGIEASVPGEAQHT
jgi:phosphoglycerate dehydrogenase-like enzyme